MKKSVSLYITDRDVDVANWINYLASRGETPMPYIVGLIAADALGVELAPIWDGTTVDPAENGEQYYHGKKWSYGWGWRGDHGEVVERTAVCISICKPEIIQVIDDLARRDIKVSVYIKALLKQNFASQVPGTTSLRELQDISNDYYLQYVTYTMVTGGATHAV